MKLPTGIKMNILKMLAFGQFLNFSPSGFLVRVQVEGTTGEATTTRGLCAATE